MPRKTDIRTVKQKCQQEHIFTYTGINGKILFAMQNLTVCTHFQQHIPSVMWGCTYNLQPTLQRVVAKHYNCKQKSHRKLVNELFQYLSVALYKWSYITTASCCDINRKLEKMQYTEWRYIIRLTMCSKTLVLRDWDSRVQYFTFSQRCEQDSRFLRCYTTSPHK